jgi:uncharacterized membrane protein HdeD (DUF308 family)
MKNNIARTIVFIGAIILVICSVSTWFNLYQYNVYKDSLRGAETIEGRIFLYCGIVSLILAFTLKGKPGKSYSILFTVIGLFSGYYFMRFTNEATPIILDNSNGIETIPTLWFYLIFISSILISIGGFIKVPKENRKENGSERT